MTTTIEPVGYMIQDKDGYAIHGIGATMADAWTEVVDAVGAFMDRDGNQIPADEAFDAQFEAYPATAALLAQVAAEGGAIAWGLVQGVACTVDEEESANA